MLAVLICIRFSLLEKSSISNTHRLSCFYIFPNERTDKAKYLVWNMAALVDGIVQLAKGSALLSLDIAEKISCVMLNISSILNYGNISFPADNILHSFKQHTSLLVVSNDDKDNKANEELHFQSLDQCRESPADIFFLMKDTTIGDSDSINNIHSSIR